MKMRKLCALILALAMVMAVMPVMSLSVGAEETAIELFDTADLTFTGEQQLAGTGWSAAENGAWVRWSQEWTDGGVWNKGGAGKYALMFFFANERKGSVNDGNATATIDNAALTKGAAKIELTYNFACQVADNIYQRWHFLDNDDKEFATFYFDKNTRATVDDPEVTVIEGQDKAYELRGKEFKIAAERNTDGKYNVTYTVDGSVIATQTLDKVNGFKAIKVDTPGWNDQWSAAALQNLKISYVPREGKADIKLVLKAGEEIIEKSVEGYYKDDEYTPSEEDAPSVIAVGDKLYTKDETAPVNIVAGENTVTVTYTEVEVTEVTEVSGEFSAIAGNLPNFPVKTVAKTADGQEFDLDINWSTDTDVDALTEETVVTYMGKVAGYKGAITVEAAVSPCDFAIGTEENPTFWHAGDNSDNANFGINNPLGFVYGGGTMVNEFDFVINAGNNKLIMYGSADHISERFSGVAAAIRFMKDRNVFEYHNGDWMTSAVSAKYDTPYRLKTVIDVTNKRYSAYVSENGGAYVTICENAAFRNANCVKIDRLFTAGAFTSKMHRTYWKDGYGVVSVERKLSDGTLIESFDVKHAIGIDYVYTNAAPLEKIDDQIYMRENNTVAPSVALEGETAKLTVTYYPVTVESADECEANLVVGDSTINLPVQAKILFSDGQYLKFNVEWDTTGVDTNAVGEYPVKGIVAELDNMEVDGIVNVKEIESLPYVEGRNTVATNNGGWNWYVEPSGTHIQAGDELARRFEGVTVDENGNERPTYTSNKGYVFTEDKTYMGWVEDGGDIVVAELDHNTGNYKRVVIHEKLESDDHNNPAVVVLPDGRIMAVYSMHTNEAYMYYRVTKNPEDISEWNTEQYYHCQSVTPDDTDVYNATYPSVFMIHDDMGVEGADAIYMGWRGVHWKPTFAKFSMPDENGKCEVLMHQTQFANTTYNYSTYDGADAPNAKTDGGRTDSGRRPYTKYDYDFERNKIYTTFTANHPDNDKRNHIFYLELDIPSQTLRTASGTVLQPLPFENQQTYRTQGAKVNGVNTNGQWGVVTDDLVGTYPDLLVFDASEQTGESFNPRNGNVERRGWTWDIIHNEKGEPCIVYVDITATPPGENGALPTWYLAESNGNTRSHHYYWYARWDSETQQWVKTFLAYGGKWWHQNDTQERCYSAGLTFDHNYPGNVIFLSLPTYGDYGNIHEIYRWVSDDNGATWTTREPITQNSKTPNARPNAIYNYKMNEDGSNAGPRLLWKTGEYRYWMNYEYKTGVMTDYAADGFVTQDDPEMFADAELYIDGNTVDKLPVGETVLNAKFTVSNISIGDGKAMLALAHYSKDGELKGLKSVNEDIPARSVPQIGVIGAPKQTDDGSSQPWAAEDNRSKMGDPEIIVEIPYEADIAEGDKISLFAWDMGIEKCMESIISIPYSVTTEANEYLMRESFTYGGEEILKLDMNEDTFNGWVAKAYLDGKTSLFTPKSYVAITKSAFGNTGLHLYNVEGSQGIMVSHALPDTNGQDYTIEFTARYINEMSWNNTDNAGFTLSHGVPAYKNDYQASSSAFQFRHKVAWRDENGRGTSGQMRNTRWFDGSGETEVFHGGLSRTIDTTNMTEGRYDKGVEYYDPRTETYIHDYHDALMAGSLYHFTVNVHPSTKKVDMTINDGYRNATYSSSYNDATSYDWNANPVDTITFSVGSDKWGEIYIDDFSVKLN